MSWKDCLLAGAAGLSFWAPAAFGQSAIPQTTEDALRAMTDAAGVVFTGTVTAVRRPAASAGVVEIDFAVADAIRGVSGSAYTLREWSGLWEASDEPFRPGQRYLMLLHTPNDAGLTSPVGGTDGAIPIRATGVAATSAGADAYDSVVANLQAGGDAAVDLGWVATRVAVPVTYRTPTPARATIGSVLRSGVQADTSATASANPPTRAVPVSSPLRTPQYSSVVKMLRNWETPDAR